MGKRQIGEMQPSELVVAIMISDLASIPMQEVDIPILSGVVPVLTLLAAEVFMSFFCLKSARLRKIFTGEPSIVIYDGAVAEHELKKLRFSLVDLTEQLRISGCAGISDVYAAVLETNGQLSVIKKTDRQPVTVGDMRLANVGEANLPCMVIMDGDVNFSELARAKRNAEWLRGELSRRGIKKIEEVFFAEVSSDGTMLIQKKAKAK
jgi:uncharacterized membrane protein YcaP (DUF421 family)